MKQKPNRKVLFMRFHLGLYTLGDNLKHGWLSDWLHKIGEEPVVLDTSLAELTDRQFVLYMFRRGYFNAAAGDTILYTKSRKASVHYEITGGQPYMIRNFSFQSKDEAINRILKADSTNTLFHTGDRYDEDVIENERSRVTAVLKNNG